MRPAHASSPGQLAELFDCEGWFDLDDIVFDPERACVVMPFREVDTAVVAKAPWSLSHASGLRGRDYYAAWRRWLLIIHGAVGPAEYHGQDLTGPHDVLAVEFDAKESEIWIHTDGSWLTVSVPVQRIDVIVEETPEHVGWGLVNPYENGVVHPVPPPKSRRIATPSWL